MGCFYCDEHHEGREAIMFKVGDMKAGTLYLFKDQAHKGRCALALKSHKKELCECDEQERNDYCADLAAASGAIKKLWGCTKINLGSFGDSNPHLHFHIVPKMCIRDRVGGGKRRVLALDARNETGKIALQVVRHGKSLL